MKTILPMKSWSITILVSILSINSSIAQHQELSEKPQMYKGTKVSVSDSTSVLSAFKRGHFNGHFRYFFMSTQNEQGLTDYYANAAGGGLRFETARFHGFQFAISGFYTFNLGSSDLGKKDSLTGQPNRYEIGLFDMNDPYNKKNIDRLEEFYIKYTYKSSSITFGKQLLNTAFINLQDGRMRPSAVEGLWVEMNEIKNLRIEAAWLYNFSPRGTLNWYNTGESIGYYPVGVNTDGSKSQYAHNLKSHGAFMLNLHSNIGQLWQLHAWEFLVNNIFNAVMVQADFNTAKTNASQAYAGLQAIRQDAVRDGGNPDPAKAYFEKGGKSFTYGARAGWKNKAWDISLNFNHITSDGRYLLPREWGRDPFFTFLPRERNEGFGNATAIMGKANYLVPKTRLKTSVAAGYYKLPDVKDFRLNKYGIPSYTQVNIDLRYPFGGKLKGLDAQFLLAGKFNNGETYDNKKYVFNKVDMLNYNFVLNFQF